MEYSKREKSIRINFTPDEWQSLEFVMKLFKCATPQEALRQLVIKTEVEAQDKQLRYGTKERPKKETKEDLAELQRQALIEGELKFMVMNPSEDNVTIGYCLGTGFIASLGLREGDFTIRNGTARGYETNRYLYWKAKDGKDAADLFQVPYELADELRKFLIAKKDYHGFH